MIEQVSYKLTPVKFPFCQTVSFKTWHNQGWNIREGWSEKLSYATKAQKLKIKEK